MRPLTDSRPKPMIKVSGKPFLEHLVEQLACQGIERILLLLGYMAECVIDHFGDGSRWNVAVKYSVAPTEMETAGRLRKARPLLDEHFLLLYGDNIWPLRLDRMWRQLLAARVPALVTVYSNGDGYSNGGVRVDDGDLVTKFDPARTAGASAGVEIGYALLQRDLLDLLPDGDGPFAPLLYPLLAERRWLVAHMTDHRYYGVGSHERLAPTEAFLRPRRAVVLDRDGVLNEKPPRGQYVHSWAEFRWRPGALAALRLFADAGVERFVATNQAGIALGSLSRAQLDAVHARMRSEANAAGGAIRAVYVCPHSWDDGCHCRKPRPGLLLDAQRDWQLDLTQTPMIGDADTDVAAAEAAGCPAIDVREYGGLLPVARALVSSQAQSSTQAKYSR
jgi:histidinol-phosphate phosphatase family protein